MKAILKEATVNGCNVQLVSDEDGMWIHDNDFYTPVCRKGDNAELELQDGMYGLFDELDGNEEAYNARVDSIIKTLSGYTKAVTEFCALHSITDKAIMTRLQEDVDLGSSLSLTWDNYPDYTAACVAHFGDNSNGDEAECKARITDFTTTFEHSNGVLVANI